MPSTSTGRAATRSVHFFLANALMWQTDFHIDALRLDAVHAIKDASAYPFLAELADSCRGEPVSWAGDFILIAESDLNDARLVRPPQRGGYGLDAIWSDDYHHAVHSLLTGEREGYYEDFGRLEDLAGAYRSGFTYSGNTRRTATADTATARRTWSPGGSSFAVKITTRSATGHAASGSPRCCDWESVKLAAGLVLLSPHIPLLFMGEEYGETAPFLYFVSHRRSGPRRGGTPRADGRNSRGSPGRVKSRTRKTRRHSCNPS